MAEILITGDKETSNALKRAIKAKGMLTICCDIEDSIDKIKDHQFVIVAASPLLTENQKLLLSAILWSSVAEDRVNGVVAIFGKECLDITASDISMFQSCVNFFTPPFDLSKLEDAINKTYSKPKIKNLSLSSITPLKRAIELLYHRLLYMGQVINLVELKEGIRLESKKGQYWVSESKRFKEYCDLTEIIFVGVRALLNVRQCLEMEEFLKMVVKFLQSDTIYKIINLGKLTAKDIEYSELLIDQLKDQYGRVKRKYKELI